MKIEIRAFFKWGEATPRQAYNFCKDFMKNGILTTHSEAEKIKLINKSHLRGITFEELQKQFENSEV